MRKNTFNTVKKKAPGKVTKLLEKFEEHQKDRNTLRQELYKMADKAIKQEFEGMQEWFKMARLEHKAMKRIFVEKGICTEDEIKVKAEEIRESKTKDGKPS